MLEVVSLKEVKEILEKEFKPSNETETVSLLSAANRIIATNIKSNEYIPSFDRSTMDGYALKAKDSFGCSESIPSVLNVIGKIQMGEKPKSIKDHECLYIPTGGALPIGADAVCMIEYTEDYNDGTIGILKPVSPGMNIISKGDDLKPDDIIIKKGEKLQAVAIGSLAALGINEVLTSKKIKVGIISTGDELVDISKKPMDGEIRDVNSYLLTSLILEEGLIPINYGIIKDDEKCISDTIDIACKECDVVLLSGGSSAGEKDNTAKILQDKGKLLFHGISIKPGKPTMAASINGKPVFGIAGHPLAVLFITSYIIKPFIRYLMGGTYVIKKRYATLLEAIDSNHGRSEFVMLELIEKNNELYAKPIITKSGLITTALKCDGVTLIDRDQEGKNKGDRIEVLDVI